MEQRAIASVVVGGERESDDVEWIPNAFSRVTKD